PPDNPDDFLKIASELSVISDYDFVALLNKDSSNIIPADWTTMANAVYSRLDQGYTGFVIAHGTDTLHYSSSALAFALGNQLNVPVVFTGSQTIPDVIHGDARTNLLRAALVAQSQLAEVVISFNHSVYRGCRVIKTGERSFDAFSSPGLGAIGDIAEHVKLSPIAKLRSLNTQNEIDFRPLFSEGILQISAIPGFHPQLLMPVLDSAQCKGIIVQSFGAGNLPDTDLYSWSEVIRYATQQLIPVVISSPFAANSTLDSAYNPGISAIESGAIAVGNMTQAAMMVKFSWVLAQAEQAIANGALMQADTLKRVAKLLQSNYVDEMD
ncbi:MAG: asparaginase domain-containing protein, partial [Methylococcales bacterium]